MFLVVGKEQLPVDMAVKNRVLDRFEQFRIGTRNVARQNITWRTYRFTRCAARLNLSSEFDDLAGLQRLPSPWSFHMNERSG